MWQEPASFKEMSRVANFCSQSKNSCRAQRKGIRMLLIMFLLRREKSCFIVTFNFECEYACDVSYKFYKRYLSIASFGDV